jgi:hypothetical protein
VSAILYLYAVVDEVAPGPLGEGIMDEPLRQVRAGEVQAVVGDLATAPQPGRENLARQDAEVRRLAERFDALLPARFGEWAADEAALAAKLAHRSGEFVRALAMVRGCVQITLRVFGEPEPVSPDEPETAGGPGTRYLTARRRELEQARSLPEIDPLREVLRPLLRAERIERQAAGRLLGTAYHLVPRERTAEYLATLEEETGKLPGGRRVVASGPWPPYAFAPEAAP